MKLSRKQRQKAKAIEREKKLAPIANRLVDVNRARDQGLNAAKDYFGQIFQLDDNLIPDNCGTFTPIEMGGKRFIITAAHCITDCPAFSSRGLIQSIEFVNAFISDLSIDSTEDLFIGEISNSQVIDQVQFLNPVGNSCASGQMIGFAGYPKNLNGRKNGTTQLKNVPYMFWNIAEQVSELGYDGIRHLQMKFDRFQAFQKFGALPVIAPTPIGCSGGPIFFVGSNVNDAKDLTNFNPNNVIGIGIEQRERQCMIGHRIEYIRGLMIELDMIGGAKQGVDISKYNKYK